MPKRQERHEWAGVQLGTWCSCLISLRLWSWLTPLWTSPQSIKYDATAPSPLRLLLLHFEVTPGEMNVLPRMVIFSESFYRLFRMPQQRMILWWAHKRATVFVWRISFVSVRERRVYFTSYISGYIRASKISSPPQFSFLQTQQVSP